MQNNFPNEVSQWQKRGAKIIEVREPEEFAGGHLPGAVNIPLADLTLIPEVTISPLGLVCASGGRSIRAAALLDEAGHRHVANLLGGTFGWMQGRKPVEFPEVDGNARQ